MEDRKNGRMEAESWLINRRAGSVLVYFFFELIVNRQYLTPRESGTCLAV
jgi:hypothetical protein